MPTIRPATKQDIPEILAFIRQLAEYEKLLHEVRADEATLEHSLFGPSPKAYAILAEEAGKPVGFAVYFYNFSTFLGKPGLYIEDLFVNPSSRGRGIGKKMLQYLGHKAVEEGCGRLEWWVLDWNKSAIDFYRSLGAEPMDEWTVFRVTGPALKKLAEDNARAA